MAIVNQSTLPNVTLPVVGTDEYVMCRDGVNLLGVPVTDAANGMPVLKNTAAPNATTPYLHLTATGTEANIDAAIVPKGTGAFSLQVADGGIAGGNKRGANAVDLQTSRTAATQVASGSGSFVAGQNNTVSATGASAVGRNNTSRDADCFAGGNSCNANGQGAFTYGVSNSTSGRATFAIGELTGANADYAFSGGVFSQANQLSSFAFGRSAVANIMGQAALSHYGDGNGTNGRYQTTLTGLRQVTTGTTATRATADGATAATANQLTLRNNSVFIVEGSVVAYDLTTLDAASFTISALIKRGANAGTTALVGTPVITRDFNDAAAATWAVTVVADTTNGAFGVNVQGAGANQIRWFVELYTQETGV